MFGNEMIEVPWGIMTPKYEAIQVKCKKCDCYHNESHTTEIYRDYENQHICPDCSEDLHTCADCGELYWSYEGSISEGRWLCFDCQSN